MPNVAVIYYSSTGTNHEMAQEVARGARDAGADVRVRIVAETAPQEAIDSREAWRAFRDTVDGEPTATNDDLEWADAVVFGTPTRFGNAASQLRAFLDGAGPLWQKGALADKVYAGFTSASNPHGGQESTLLTLFTSVFHFGGYLVTPGYTDGAVAEAGGNPYGPSVTSGSGPTDADRAHARYLGQRVTKVAAKLVGGDQ